MKREHIKSESYIEWLKSLGCVFYVPFDYEDGLKELIGFDIIFRSPGCLPTRKEIILEKERGALVTTEVEQVIKLTEAHVIGITGSDGKTTTTTLIDLILKARRSFFIYFISFKGLIESKLSIISILSLTSTNNNFEFSSYDIILARYHMSLFIEYEFLLEFKAN